MDATQGLAAILRDARKGRAPQDEVGDIFRASKAAIQYSEASMMKSRSRSVLDTPLEPVIGLAEGETRWRSMTIFARSGLSRRSSTSDCVRRSSQSEGGRRKRRSNPPFLVALSIASRSGMKSRGAVMEPLCALNPPDLELLQRASHLSREPGGTKN